MTDRLFDVAGQVAMLTGGGGVLTGAMARALAQRGVRVAVGTRTDHSAQLVVEDIVKAGGEAISVRLDVGKRDTLARAADEMLKRWGRVDLLINGAGGNRRDATVSDTTSFFDLPEDSLRSVIDLNLLGTILPCQVFGRIMAGQKSGSIINISSMSGLRPLTRVVGYSAAKAAINNFTQWLAVHLAQTYDPAIRVNAIAPGFFESEQNRFLLRDAKTGALSTRGRQIIDHTPAGRFGEPADLIGTLIWLASPASSFVNGAVIPVDGGFAAFSGV